MRSSCDTMLRVAACAPGTMPPDTASQPAIAGTWSRASEVRTFRNLDVMAVSPMSGTISPGDTCFNQ